MIRTDLHNQGSPKRSQWSKPKEDQVGLSGWDLALGMDHDMTQRYLLWLREVGELQYTLAM